MFDNNDQPISNTQGDKDLASVQVLVLLRLLDFIYLMKNGMFNK